MSNEKLMNVTIQGKDGRYFGVGDVIEDFTVTHTPKLSVSLCYCPDGSEKAQEQLKNLLAFKTDKSSVSIFMGTFTFRDLLITDCFIDELDGSESPAMNCIRLQVESCKAVNKKDLDAIYP